MTMRKQIQGDRLKVLRERKGLSQDQLAKKASLNAETVYRLENGKQKGVRARTIQGLSKALTVEPEVLTGEKPLLVDALATQTNDWRYQLNVRLDGIARNAFSLVSLQYRIPIARLVEIAPLLFVLAAEGSLRERKDRLNSLESLLDQVNGTRKNFAHLPICITPTYEAGDAIYEESESIRQKDILGAEIPNSLFARFSQIQDNYDESEHNPFVAYLRSLAEKLETSDDPQCFCKEYSTSFVGIEIASRLAGGDKDLAKAILSGLIQLHEMPKNLLADTNEPQRIEWLRTQHASVKAELAKVSIADLDLDALDLESQIPEDGPIL